LKKGDKIMRYILDSVGDASGIRTFGAMAIQNLDYPVSVEPNTPFTVMYDARNTTGVEQHAFGYIIDFSTQQYVIGSYWEAMVPAGAAIPSVVPFQGITETFSGEVRVGHIEGEEPPLQCIDPAGNEYQFICGDEQYGNAPTPGHRYQCQDGTWVDLGYDPTNCPIEEPPPPTGINPMYVMAAVAAVVCVGIVIIVVKK